jgi:hypothetical protein
MTEDKDIDVRITVDKEFRERLELVKKYYGIKNNAEMIRILVSEKFHEIEDKKKKI